MLELYVFDESFSEKETVMFDVFNLKYYLVAKDVFNKCLVAPETDEIHCKHRYYVPETDAIEIPCKQLPIMMKEDNSFYCQIIGQQFEIVFGWAYHAGGKVYILKNFKPFGYKKDLEDIFYVPQYIIENLNPIHVIEDVKKPLQEVKLIHCNENDFEGALQKYLDNGYELYGNLSTCYKSAGWGVQVYQLVIKKNK